MAAFALLGLDRHGCGLDELGRVAAALRSPAAPLVAIRAATGADEAALLSTCNRIEILLAGAALPADALLLAGARALAPAAWTVRRDQAARRHLLRVACSLESAAIGEAQIQGQVRDARNTAHALGSAGPLLLAAFDLALCVGKKVRRETDLARCGLDLPHRAVAHLRRAAPPTPARPIALLGTGALAAAVLAARPKELRHDWIVVGRDRARTAAFAAAHGAAADSTARFLGTASPLTALIAATRCDEPLLTAGELAARCAPGAPVVDLGLPRNLAADARDVVDLADLADLERHAPGDRHDLATTIALIEQWIEQALARRERHSGVTP